MNPNRLQILLTTQPDVHNFAKPEYPDLNPEYPDFQIRSFRGYTRSFARSVKNPEYPGLYPESPDPTAFFAPKTEIVISSKTNPQKSNPT